MGTPSPPNAAVTIIAAQQQMRLTNLFTGTRTFTSAKVFWSVLLIKFERRKLAVLFRANWPICLFVDFIFEVADRCGKTAIDGQIGVADKPQAQLEVERFGECLLLKDARTNDLARDINEYVIFARGQDVDLADLSLLMQLFGAELDRFLRSLVQ